MTRQLAFFGAFNPPTSAHLGLAEYAMRHTAADRVVFVPSKADYIRYDQGKDFVFDDEARLRMLKAAAKTRPWILVWDREIRAEKQPRTYETLCQMRDEGLRPALLLGSDKLGELRTGWLHVPEIAREFGLVCLARGRDDCMKMIEGDSFLSGLGIEVIASPEWARDVSSSMVRERLRRGEDIGALLTPEVARFVAIWQKARGFSQTGGEGL